MVETTHKHGQVKWFKAWLVKSIAKYVELR